MAGATNLGVVSYEDSDMRGTNRAKWTKEEDDQLRQIIGKTIYLSRAVKLDTVGAVEFVSWKSSVVCLSSTISLRRGL